MMQTDTTQIREKADPVRTVVVVAMYTVVVIIATVLSLVVHEPAETDAAKHILGVPSWTLPWVYLGVTALVVICRKTIPTELLMGVAINCVIVLLFTLVLWRCDLNWWFGLAAGIAAALLAELFPRKNA
jgi:hypothetical protein